jgi:hypothetical protein
MIDRSNVLQASSPWYQMDIFFVRRSNFFNKKYLRVQFNDRRFCCFGVDSKTIFLVFEWWYVKKANKFGEWLTISMVSQRFCLSSMINVLQIPFEILLIICTLAIFWGIIVFCKLCLLILHKSLNHFHFVILYLYFDLNFHKFLNCFWRIFETRSSNFWNKSSLLLKHLCQKSIRASFFYHQ